MGEENFPVQQPAGAVNCPLPRASPELVARWLRRLRIGALCGFAVVASDAAYMILGTVGIAPGRRLASAIGCAVAIVGGVSVWLLTSPEPHNRKWLWPCRIVLRLCAGALIVACVASIVIYGFLADLPEKGANDTTWSYVTLVGVGGAWVLLY